MRKLLKEASRKKEEAEARATGGRGFLAEVTDLF